MSVFVFRCRIIFLYLSYYIIWYIFLPIKVSVFPLNCMDLDANASSCFNWSSYYESHITILKLFISTSTVESIKCQFIIIQIIGCLNTFGCFLSRSVLLSLLHLGFSFSVFLPSVQRIKTDWIITLKKHTAIVSKPAQFSVIDKL